MTELVNYRGPNGFGFAYATPGVSARAEIIHNEARHPRLSRPVVGLGNRRLAILDVSPLGNMPMESDDGACVITYNGEIYNYKEIRLEIENSGRRFRTKTDTEVILRAYQEWGEDCLSHFNGMWSFALWDREKQRLFCARDRFGVKPFYYALSGGSFFFGSEIKQILQVPGIRRVANASAVFNFLERSLVDYSGETFFEGIHQLPGGHCLVLDLADRLSLTVRRYWELRIEPNQPSDEDTVVEEFRARFENAVRLRLRSDVPVGACLSGGLDSSAVVCEAKRVAPDIDFHSFSACFKDDALDERRFISAVLSATHSPGHWTFPEADSFWRTIELMLYHQDEPVGSSNVFAQWCVMADAKQHGIPVILGGQGGDETLCGYQKYRYFYLWHLFRSRDPRLFRESVLWARNGTRSHWTLEGASRYFPPAARRPFSLAERVCVPEFGRDSAAPQPELGAGRSIAERQKADLVYASLPSLLHYEDRNSMAHSVESRLPFLDYKLVEFVVNCSPSLKLRDGWSKWILRKALEGTLPDSVRFRKTKLGFDTPQTAWMRHGLQNGHRDVWQAPRLRMERFLSAKKLAHESSKFLRAEPRALQAEALFRAICLELWARVHSVS
ncbi:MAG: asparagine synthase (glutamine-hydrolyzing) [Candidatus Acidiferrales bacterium]